jgi:hypothetical protein
VRAGALIVGFDIPAELAAHLAAGWPLPARVVDLGCEFTWLTNGRDAPFGRTLAGALVYHGVDTLPAAGRSAWRQLARRGGPYSDRERQALLDGCAVEARALGRLLARMAPRIDWPRALFRGRCLAAVARVEQAGVPIDTDALAALQDNWDRIKDRLIRGVDRHYHVFAGRAFRPERWARWVESAGLPWPRRRYGALDLSDATFKRMASIYPEVRPVWGLRALLVHLG